MEVISFNASDLLNISMKEILFSCNCCGWTGTESDLGVSAQIDSSLVCCPNCKDSDVRVVN